MNPYRNSNFNQGMPYNRNYSNQRNFNNRNNSNHNPNNFHAPNPNFQPMPQNNQLDAMQMLAQIQSNPQLQINLLNQLQNQNYGTPFNPYMGPHNHMMGMQNTQLFAQNQMFRGNQMMSFPGNVGSGFGSGPVIGVEQQNLGYGNPNAVMAQAYHNDKSVHSKNSANTTPAKTFHSSGKERSHNRFQKSQTPDTRNSKGNMKRFNKRGGRGQHNARVQKSSSVYTSEKGPTVPKRSINYTTTEIKLWLDARKKNFPTKANIAKKNARDIKNIEDADAKLRRQQLKEVLRKQAELGVEVAEVPKSYLREPGEDEREAKNGTSREKFNRSGRSDNLHSKRQKYDKYEGSFSKREPSLLQKLLSVDIKKDRTKLLQVFRFMVLNDFLKKWPEKPLEFPTVILKESNAVEEIKNELNEEDNDIEVADQNMKKAAK